jgi:hypothetical protein
MANGLGLVVRREEEIEKERKLLRKGVGFEREMLAFYSQCPK